MRRDRFAQAQYGHIPQTMARVAIEIGEPVEDPGFVDFATAGSYVPGEFHCVDCGYGVVVQLILPACPMCRGTVWERRDPLAARLAS
jgi:hypothetical protein